MTYSSLLFCNLEFLENHTALYGRVASLATTGGCYIVHALSVARFNTERRKSGRAGSRRTCHVMYCGVLCVMCVYLRLQIAVSRASDAWRRVRYSRHPPTTHRLGTPPAPTAVQVPLVLARVVSGAW